MERKKVGFRIIQDKIDLSTYDLERVIRSNELFSATLPLDAGKFSDVGYRMRKNHFALGDKILRDIYPYDNIFYDFNYFNKDTYDVDPTNTLLSEFYIRLEVDEI